VVRHAYVLYALFIVIYHYSILLVTSKLNWTFYWRISWANNHKCNDKCNHSNWFLEMYCILGIVSCKWHDLLVKSNLIRFKRKLM
jgi:hypothetical protein